MKLNNKKGFWQLAFGTVCSYIFPAVLAGSVVAGIGASYAIGGKELGDKNVKSLVAGVMGKCQGAYPDSNCIPRENDITRVSAQTSIINR